MRWFERIKTHGYLPFEPTSKPLFIYKMARGLPSLLHAFLLFLCFLSSLLHFNPIAVVPVPHTSSLHFFPLFTASPCAALRLFIFFVLTQVLQYFQRRLKKLKSDASLPPRLNRTARILPFLCGSQVKFSQSAIVRGGGEKGENSPRHAPPRAHP
jgi:hypothetical protein